MKSCGHRNTVFGSFAILMFVGITAAAVSVRAQEDSSLLPMRPKWNEAVIYFYRNSLVSDWAGHACMYIDGQKRCDLLRDQYSYAIVSPGEHTITMRQSIKSGPDTLAETSKWKNKFATFLTIDGPLAPGRTYFVAYEVRSQPWANTVTWKLKTVPEKDALKQIAKCSYVTPVLEKLEAKTATTIPEQRRSTGSSETGLIPRNSDVQPASDAPLRRSPSSLLDSLPRGAKPSIPIEPQPMFLLQSVPGAQPPGDESSQ